MADKKEIEEQAEKSAQEYIGTSYYAVAKTAFVEGYKKALEESPSWIDVNESLPENTFTNVLCCLSNEMVIVCTFHGNDNWQLLGTIKEVPKNNPVMFWQPLPSPPTPAFPNPKENA